MEIPRAKQDDLQFRYAYLHKSSYSLGRSVGRSVGPMNALRIGRENLFVVCRECHIDTPFAKKKMKTFPLVRSFVGS